MNPQFRLKFPMNINGYHCNLKMSICFTWLKWWPHQAHFNERVSEKCAFMHLVNVFAYMYVKELSLSFLYWKQNWKLLLVHFLLPLLFRQVVKKLRILFGPLFNISAYSEGYDLKFSIQTKFDTLISNLKSHFQYDIFMMSSWRNVWKTSKPTSFVS